MTDHLMYEGGACLWIIGTLERTLRTDLNDRWRMRDAEIMAS